MECGSYLLLESGMRVQNRSGDDLGSIAEVVADEASDIFRGIVVSSHRIDEPVFVGGEHVVRVVGEIATIDFDLEHLTHATDRNGGLRAVS